MLQQGLLALLGQAWERLLKRRQDPALTKLASFIIRLERTGEWGQLRSKQCNFKGGHRKAVHHIGSQVVSTAISVVHAQEVACT